MTDQQLAPPPSTAPDAAAARTLDAVAGRYRVGGLVERTAFYEVLEAEDEHLERDVQLLVLRDELSDEASAIGLFAATVVAAAELPHPILAGIFDAGIEEQHGRPVRWAVREPVIDPPLTRLDAPETVDLTAWTGWLLQVAVALADGLKIVQSHGIVHGALSPATVHVSPPGVEPVRVKVDGFGPQPGDLADLTDPDRTRRMWAEFTASLPTPSPEQREGAAPTRRSDVFGYGLTLLQLLLTAETHAAPDPLDAEPVEPLLRALHNLATRATSKSPTARPYSFVTIEDELRRLAAGRLPEPHGPAGASGDAPTAVLGGWSATGAADDAPTVVLPPSSALTAATARPPREMPGTDTLRQRLVQPLPERRRSGWRTLRSVFLIVVALATVAAVLWAVLARDPGPAPGDVILPAVAGSTVEAATLVLSDAGLIAGGVREQPDPAVAAGLVAGTDPGAGTSLSRGTAVTLLVSTGPDLVAVPQLEGLTLTDAQTALTNAGLTAGDIIGRDSTLPEGTVLGSDPAFGASVGRDSAVRLIVATGRVTIPGDIVGQTLQAAAAQLQALGLQVQTRRETTDAVGAGLIAGSDPGIGSSVEAGSIVTLLVAVAPLPEPRTPPVPSPTAPTPPPPTTAPTPIPEPTDPSDDDEEGDEG